MSFVSSTIAATASPSTALYDIIETALLAEGWTFIETVSAANAGTTAACEVMQAPGADWYAVFEVDDANIRIRVRVAKQKAGTGASFQLNRGIFADSVVTTTTQVLADGFRTNTAATIVTTTGYVDIVTNVAGFPYMLGVRESDGDLLFVNTVSAGSSGSFMAGFFEPLFPSIDTYPLFSFGGARGPAWNIFTDSNPSGASVRVATEVNMAASTNMHGGCCYAWKSPWLNSSSAQVNGGQVGALGTSSRHFSGDVLAGKAYMTGVAFTSTSTYYLGKDGTTSNIIRGWRGSVPGVYSVQYGSAATQVNQITGSPVTIDGVQGYMMGYGHSNTYNINAGSGLCVVPAEAFA